ncbi:MAG TPA: DUF3817 domain-containing protein [Intrasporangiaceae bacterium]|nr:DUF3817 domain-containing protein [Intrasporangiaceae bacterium]
MTPRALFRRFAFAEMVTWALLILGMVLKYVTKTTDLGVKVFGLAHGVVFLGYVLVTLAVWVNQRWPLRTAALALAAAVPPFLTVWAEHRIERQGLLDADDWRLGRGRETPQSLPERVVAWAIARPALAVVTGVVAVTATTAVLLWIGPPVPSQRG